VVKALNASTLFMEWLDPIAPRQSLANTAEKQLPGA
jgi:hypothetical protein